jgi:hypothetical protein
MAHDRADRAESEAATSCAFSGRGHKGAPPRPFEFRLLAETYRKDKRSLPGDFSKPCGRGRMPESKGKGLEKDPKCVKCGSKMRFSCTEPEPGQPGFVHHIYECTKCRSTQSFVTPV